MFAAWADLMTGQRLGRAFWALMLAVHTPAWLGSCDLGGWAPQRGDLLRCLLLTLSQVLFLLKLAGVPWLRFTATRRTWLALGLALALLHAGVASRALHDETTPLASGLSAVLNLPLAAGIAGAMILRRHYGARGVGPARQSLWLALRPALTDPRQAFLPPRNWLLARTCLPNRAPPRG